jgi:hypothetical protein
MTFASNNKYTISPKLSSEVGTHQIAVLLSDGAATSKYSFNVFVTAVPTPPPPPVVAVVVPPPPTTIVSNSSTDIPADGTLMDGPPSDAEIEDEDATSSNGT